MGEGRIVVRRVAVAAGTLLASAVIASAAIAEPVELHQGSYIGAGYSFNHAGTCIVVTARHVVPEVGVPVSVLDRNGAQAEGSRTYENESFDLALVTVSGKSPVACTAAWPDTAWLANAKLSGRAELHAVRHYPNGRETIVRLEYAGSMRKTLTLAPMDKLTIRESDSGTIVELDDRLVGIVQSVDPSTDRVNVLMFDAIDELVGDRFHSSRGPVSYAGVLSNGRPNPNWSTYVQAWIAEKEGRRVMPAPPPPARGAAPPPRTACEVKVDVLAWEQVYVPNPDYNTVELELKACGKKGFFYEQTCAAGRRATATTPRNLASQKVTLNTTVTPPNGAPVSKLETTTHTPPASPALSRAELEQRVPQEAAGPAIKELLGQASCP